VVPASPNKLPASLREKLRPVSESVFGEHGFAGSRLVRYDLAQVTDAERDEAIRALHAALRPCTAKVAGDQIARLRAMTKSRREATTDDAMLIEALMDVLMEYPEDAVYEACGRWRAGHVFFPAEAELRSYLDDAVSERRCALRAFTAAKPKKDPNPAPERIQARDVDAILAKVARKVGKTVEEISRAQPRAIERPEAKGPTERQLAISKMTAEQQAAYWLAQMEADPVAAGSREAVTDPVTLGNQRGAA